MLYSSMQFPFGSKKINFGPEFGQEQRQQLKIHELKSEVTVKDGDQIEAHLIYFNISFADHLEVKLDKLIFDIILNKNIKMLSLIYF